jgi:hypothetical protein
MPVKAASPQDQPEGWRRWRDSSGEDLAGAAEVFGGMDRQRHLDQLALAELVDHQSDFCRDWGNPVGAMLARGMKGLALRIRWVKAETSKDYEARHEIVEHDV